MSTENRPRVAVIDDETQTRRTFAVAYPQLDVVGSYSSVEEELSHSPAVDLVVLDLMLDTGASSDGLLQGTAAVHRLSQKGLVCLYTDERRPLVIARCFAAGAIGLVRKSDSLEDNAQGFLKAATGSPVVPRSMVGLAELLSRRDRLPELTERQVQVLNARARGESWRSLSRRLNISPKTAYDHLEAVTAKMVWYLHDVGLDYDASPADVERALGLAPGDLDDRRWS
ncbi:LuxR C-terminal-related transcriptional regulator [uncultured Bifidobacterium sp.]|uniref:LuxR C-terminal-related transcriptional regulator n=1 Tax=uncultured Bifidobacterium sp. TaxID=165187 RepID=UPI0026238F3A|nr:LuxR C-terminal-related transcriptional regulator [uncultured Bifidobacterium sp.]